MPWNEPGGKDKDPWGNSGQKKNDQGPPNLDEIFKKLQSFISGFSGGNRKTAGGGRSSKNGQNGIFFGLIFFVIVAAYLYKSVYIVDEKERAIILRFGKYVETVGPGLHLYFPPIETRYLTMVTGYRVYRVNQEMLTKDENIVQVALSVQYNIADLKSYELSVANPVLSLEDATQSALRHAVGSSSMHNVLTEGRETMADEVKVRLQSYLDRYNTGLAVSRVNVESAQPPKQVQTAFDDVIRAREDEERSKNTAQAYANQIIPEARGQVQRIIEQADAYKQEVVALAEGQASRFVSIHKAYEQAPEITRERLYLETMQDVLSNSTKVLVDSKGSGNIFYLPLDKMMKNSPAAPNEAAQESSETLSSVEKNIISSKAAEQLRSQSRRTRRTGL